MVVKDFALGAIRAADTTKRGRRVTYLGGPINTHEGRRGLYLSPYEAKALAEWLMAAIDTSCAVTEPK